MFIEFNTVESTKAVAKELNNYKFDKSHTFKTHSIRDLERVEQFDENAFQVELDPFKEQVTNAVNSFSFKKTNESHSPSFTVGAWTAKQDSSLRFDITIQLIFVGMIWCIRARKCTRAMIGLMINAKIASLGQL